QGTQVIDVASGQPAGGEDLVDEAEGAAVDARREDHLAADLEGGEHGAGGGHAGGEGEAVRGSVELGEHPLQLGAGGVPAPLIGVEAVVGPGVELIGRGQVHR